MADILFSSNHWHACESVAIRQKHADTNVLSAYYVPTTNENTWYMIPMTHKHLVPQLRS